MRSKARLGGREVEVDEAVRLARVADLLDVDAVLARDASRTRGPRRAACRSRRGSTIAGGRSRRFSACERRGVRVVVEVAAAGVCASSSVHRLEADDEPVELRRTTGTRVVPGARVDQDLRRRPRRRRASRSRSASAADRLPPALSPAIATVRRRHAERPALRDRPAGDRLAVVESRRERVLRRQPVPDRDHDRARCVRTARGRRCP